MSAKKVAFITGGNRGLGLETAKRLGKTGIQIVIGSRNLEQGKKALTLLKSEGVDAEVIQFDVLASKDHLAARDYLAEKYGRLDILINNAGVMLEGGPEVASQNNKPVSGLSEKILRDTLDANFFSVVALTETLLDLIRKSPAGRIVNLSSILGSLTLQADPKSPIYGAKAFAYNTSKTALNSFTIHLAYELRNTAIKVNSVHPGWVKTEMGGESAPMNLEDGSITSTQLALIPADGPTGGFFHMGDTLPW